MFLKYIIDSLISICCKHNYKGRNHWRRLHGGEWTSGQERQYACAGNCGSSTQHSPKCPQLHNST